MIGLYPTSGAAYDIVERGFDIGTVTKQGDKWIARSRIPPDSEEAVPQLEVEAATEHAAANALSRLLPAREKTRTRSRWM